MLSFPGAQPNHEPPSTRSEVSAESTSVLGLLWNQSYLSQGTGHQTLPFLSNPLRNAPPASAIFWSLIVTGTLASNNQVALMAFISQSARDCFPSCCLRLFSLCLKKGWGFYSSVSRLPQHSASSHPICHFHSLVSQTERRSCFKVLLNSSSLETEYFLTIIVSYVGPLFWF